MRSDLVYKAGIQVENRFLLATTVMQVVRKFHIDATRTEDTINKVFSDVATNPNYVGILPEVVPPSPIDTLLDVSAA